MHKSQPGWSSDHHKQSAQGTAEGDMTSLLPTFMTSLLPKPGKALFMGKHYLCSNSNCCCYHGKHADSMPGGLTLPAPIQASKASFSWRPKPPTHQLTYRACLSACLLACLPVMLLSCHPILPACPPALLACCCVSCRCLCVCW